MKPHLIFYCDETGLSSVPNHLQKSVGIKGIKSINITSAEKSSTTTLLMCCNAVGAYIPATFCYL